jgi:hypothetical protein
MLGTTFRFRKKFISPLLYVPRSDDDAGASRDASIVARLLERARVGGIADPLAGSQVCVCAAA